MNRTQHLLEILSEECAEVAQRVSKAKRFGLKEVQKGQRLSNATRIKNEYADLLGIYAMLASEGVLKIPNRNQLEAKAKKVEKFLKYCKKIGTLNE